jgi:hypothetical protein
MEEIDGKSSREMPRPTPPPPTQNEKKKHVMLVVHLWQRCSQFFVLIITNEKCIYNEYVYNPSHQKSKPLLPSLYSLLKGETNKNKNKK